MDLDFITTNFETLLTLAFGLIIGSFTNVVISRLPEKKSVVRPKSRCPKCQGWIAWYDNVPVLSYLLLRGKCRKCGNPISFQYPVVELLVALLFLATKVRFGFGPALWFHDWPLVTLLVAITFIDLKHRIIPDVLSLPGLILGLATCWMVPLGFWASLSGAALGFGVFYGFSWLYYKITHRVGLGGGDIKLLAMLGAFLGPLGVFTTILVSSIAGSVIGIAWALISKKSKVMQVAIPYGPFLVIGALYYYLLGDLVWHPFMTPM